MIDCCDIQTARILRAFTAPQLSAMEAGEAAAILDAFVRYIVWGVVERGNRFRRHQHLNRYFISWYESNNAETRCPLPPGVSVPHAIARLRNPRTVTVPASESRHPSLVAQRDATEQARIHAQEREYAAWRTRPETQAWERAMDSLREVTSATTRTTLRSVDVDFVGEAAVLTTDQERADLIAKHLANIESAMGRSVRIVIQEPAQKENRAS